MLLRIAAVVMVTLAACNSSDAANSSDENSPDPSGWRTASGKAPTKAEFAALAATCQDQKNDGSVDACLVELGLKKAQ